MILKTNNKSVAGELILFSLPLIMSGILQQLYSWADAFIVGHAEGELQLGAIGATGSISILLINTILGFTLGLSIMAAQNYGRGDTLRIRRILSCFLPVMCVIYLVLTALCVLCTGPILAFMDTPAELFGYAVDYLRIVLLGIPFLAVYNLFAAILRAVGNTKVAFYAVLISSGLNVIFDVLFVVVLPCGVGGAAFATVISQIAMTIFTVIYAALRYPHLMPHRSEPLFDGPVLREGAHFSIPPTIQNSVTAFGNLILQNFMNGFGAATVLAITTAYRVDSIMLLPVLNLGAAISSMVARSKGADDQERIRKYFKSGMAMMILVSAVLALAMFLFGAFFVGIFGVTGEALKMGETFFRDLSIFYTIFGIATVLRSVLEGLGDITCCSVIGVIVLGLRIALSYILKPICGGRTIAFAEGISWIVMLGLFALRILWQHRRASARAEC